MTTPKEVAQRIADEHDADLDEILEAAETMAECAVPVKEIERSLRKKYSDAPIDERKNQKITITRRTSDEHTHTCGPHKHVLKRPVRHGWHDEPPEKLSEYIRLECLDCGKISQGHRQIVGRVFRDRGCDETPERYRVGWGV